MIDFYLKFLPLLLILFWYTRKRIVKLVSIEAVMPLVRFAQNA